MDRKTGSRPRKLQAGARSTTIKDLSAELELSITTISRALNGYSDVGEKTRERVIEAASRLGYRPNRNAQRLVTRRTHNIAWVQPDNERKFVDPHFIEVMTGVLRGARLGGYDIVLTSETPERELGAYERYVNDNSVDGFIIDLPRDDDRRIAYLVERNQPFVVHGRERNPSRYGWVDVDNYGNFYRLTRFLVANGHRRIAFINGDESFNYALYRRHGVEDALADAGLGPQALQRYSSLHPMGQTGFRLTQEALADTSITAIIYSSILMATEGFGAVVAAGRADPASLAIATMDDQLRYLDGSQFAGRFTLVRSSLRDAGVALVEELIRQCDRGGAPKGTLIASEFVPAQGSDGASFAEPLPQGRERG